ncbi:MAG: NAD(P)/FAD-dependent oxidoreductase [Micrococcales bacterium]|nr:NAD(P)/FAD-dependent oxidoreductase [Micrococcales bacterium]
MARVVVLGAGISGHTASLHLRRLLGKEHEVVVVSPNARYNWIPSNIWVGVGRMTPEDVTFPLAPVYGKRRIGFHHAKAVTLWPEGQDGRTRGGVDIEHTSAGREGRIERIEYDYLINATGPKLDFAATPGLGPEGHSLSVCTAEHAASTFAAFADVIRRLKNGEPQTLLVGMGHGTCTGEGAAFAFAFNVEHELRTRGLRDLAEIIYLTNEYELGDFGVGGLSLTEHGRVTSSRLWTESLLRERGIKAVVRAHVQRVEAGKAYYETLDGTEGSIAFDFAMLLPPFRGVDLQAFDHDGAEITSELFDPSGFLKVDADYSTRPFDQWQAADWPRTYVSPKYATMFGVGIAFAPPHPISTPRTTDAGTVISPAPPRTGMPSAVMGRQVACSVADLIDGKSTVPTHSASMAEMGAPFVTSAGTGIRGAAASLTMFPVVPDYRRYPEYGRDLAGTTAEIGLAGHWLKRMLHHLFIYKAKGRPGWSFIPE